MNLHLFSINPIRRVKEDSLVGQDKDMLSEIMHSGIWCSLSTYQGTLRSKREMRMFASRIYKEIIFYVSLLSKV